MTLDALALLFKGIINSVADNLVEPESDDDMLMTATNAIPYGPEFKNRLAYYIDTFTQHVNQDLSDLLRLVVTKLMGTLFLYAQIPREGENIENYRDAVCIYHISYSCIC